MRGCASLAAYVGTTSAPEGLSNEFWVKYYVNPNCRGSRAMIIAAMTFGTYCLVSGGSAWIRYKYQKFRCLIGSVTFLMPCLTFVEPEL